MSSFLKTLKIKPLDPIFFVLFLAVSVFSIVAVYKEKSGKSVLIINSPEGEYIYDMNTDRELKIKGTLGYSIIRIKDGSAFFVDSPCPNKTCVQCAPIHNDFEWIACMPNQVFIRIEKESDTNNDTDISTF